MVRSSSPRSAATSGSRGSTSVSGPGQHRVHQPAGGVGHRGGQVQRLPHRGHEDGQVLLPGPFDQLEEPVGGARARTGRRPGRRRCRSGWPRTARRPAPSGPPPGPRRRAGRRDRSRGPCPGGPDGTPGHQDPVAAGQVPVDGHGVVAGGLRRRPQRRRPGRGPAPGPAPRPAPASRARRPPGARGTPGRSGRPPGRRPARGRGPPGGGRRTPLRSRRAGSTRSP